MSAWEVSDGPSFTFAGNGTDYTSALTGAPGAFLWGIRATEVTLDGATITIVLQTNHTSDSYSTPLGTTTSTTPKLISNTLTVADVGHFYINEGSNVGTPILWMLPTNHRFKVVISGGGGSETITFNPIYAKLLP